MVRHNSCMPRPAGMCFFKAQVVFAHSEIPVLWRRPRAHKREMSKCTQAAATKSSAAADPLFKLFTLHYSAAPLQVGCTGRRVAARAWVIHAMCSHRCWVVHCQAAAELGLYTHRALITVARCCASPHCNPLIHMPMSLQFLVQQNRSRRLQAPTPTSRCRPLTPPGTTCGSRQSCPGPWACC